MTKPHSSTGQATVASIGIVLVAVALGVLLMMVGRVYVAQGELQQAADVAAATLARPAGDDPVARARAVARANGAREFRISEDPPTGPRRVVVQAPAPRLAFVGSRMLEAAALVPTSWGGSATPTFGVGAAHAGEYHGPLVSIDGALACQSVARDYRVMQRAAVLSGVRLWATSGYRTVAEQAVLYADLGPAIAAPPGASLHHVATELDLAVGPNGSPTHRWLIANASGFNFIQRYSWEPWHWGNVRGC